MEERIKIVNEIIVEISNRGRNFFKEKSGVSQISKRGNKLYMSNFYKCEEICLNTKYGYPPKGFSHGGTLWGLVKDFKDFIKKGGDTNHNNGYGGLYCPHWGYPVEDMKAIQDKAKELGYLKS